MERKSLKIVLLGNSGVGKTSLVNRWITGAHNKSITPTVGANHQKKTVNIDGQPVDLFIWDTAGQEQFQALTPLYTRSASCAIITASIIDRDSFNSLDMWKELLVNSCENVPPMVLVVNKSDLANEDSVSNEEIEEKYIGAFDGIFFSSAFTGEGVDEAFMQAGKQGLNFSKSIEQGRDTPSQVNVDQTKTKKDGGCC